MNISPAQQRAAAAVLLTSLLLVVGLVACSAPSTPSGTGATTTTTIAGGSTSTTVAGGGGSSSTTVTPGGSTTTTVAGSGGGSSTTTTLKPGGSTTTTTTTTTVAGQAPVARIGVTLAGPGYYGLPVTFSAAFSTDADGSIVSYLWTFGSGGATSTAANPTFTYPAAGTYTVSLKVTDNSGLSNTASTTVGQPAPTAPVTVEPAPVMVPNNPGYGFIKVWWNGQAANQLIFIDICSKPTTTPGFNVATDCSSLSEVNPNGTASGSGLVDAAAFRGQEPAGDNKWGCFAAGDVAPAGVLKLTTCYVRVTNKVVSNNLDAKDIAFTIN